MPSRQHTNALFLFMNFNLILYYFNHLSNPVVILITIQTTLIFNKTTHARAYYSSATGINSCVKCKSVTQRVRILNIYSRLCWLESIHYMTWHGDTHGKYVATKSPIDRLSPLQSQWHATVSRAWMLQNLPSFIQISSCHSLPELVLNSWTLPEICTPTDISA